MKGGYTDGLTRAEIDLERKKQILLLRSLYRSFVDTSFAIIFRSGLDDQVLFSNHLFVETFGFAGFRKAKGYNASLLFENQDDYFQLKERLKQHQKVHQVAVRLRKLNNQSVIALVNANVQRNERNENVINWIVLDISERVEFERSMEEKNTQLAKINSQMEKFLYSTSHDLRSPITTILGLVNLLRLDTADRRVIDYSTKIESSARKLDKIIQDLISFSKTTYMNINSEKIEFELLTWKVINLHRGEAVFNNLKINVAVRGEAPFYSDSNRIEIILENLIRNAIQFSDPSKVRPFLHIVVCIYSEHATIEVHDNGVGIAREYFDQIFKMFYKASVHARGAGLGLYIAKEGAERLGGNITVESEVGFGSVFKVHIPNSPKGLLINRKNQLRNGH